MDPSDGDVNDIEQQERLNLLIGRYWLALITIYRGRRRRRNLMTDLELRRFFTSEAIIRDLKSFLNSRYNGIVNRNVPDMQELCNQELEITVTDFIEVYADDLRAKGYSLERAEVEQRIATVLTNPASDLFYCLHCKSTVHITPQFKCPQCCGWCLLEMDPNDEQSIPSLPLESYMQQTARRLLPDDRLPDLRNDAITNVRLTQNQVQENRECSICHEEFMVGERAVHIVCSHIFHKKCIKEWFDTPYHRIKRQCPYCRRSMPSSDSLYNIYLRLKAMEGRYLPPPPSP